VIESSSRASIAQGAGIETRLQYHLPRAFLSHSWVLLNRSPVSLDDERVIDISAIKALPSVIFPGMITGKMHGDDESVASCASHGAVLLAMK